MNTSAEEVLRINNLSVSFRAGSELRKAVNDLSLVLPPASTLAIVGESGSGKSVTSLALMGLLPERTAVISSGQILLGENKLLDAASGENHTGAFRGKQLAMIFQEPMTALNPVMTCGQQVAEVLIRHRGLSSAEAKEKTIALFAEVNIPFPAEAWKKYPHEMSGGQRQRVMIAMAMACEPRVLIADEPTTALDVTVQKAVLVTLKELQRKRGMSMIFITHDLGVVADIADYIVVMRSGQVLEQGPSSEVLSRPVHPYTRALLACRPVLGKKVAVLPTVNEPNPTQTAEHVHSPGVGHILRVSHISKSYRARNGERRKAVDDVSFEIFSGETLGLVGESGCGKTTLSRIIMGLIHPDEGEITFMGRSVVGPSAMPDATYRKDVQLIFQDPFSSLNPRITIGEALCEPMRVHRVGNNEKEREQRAVSWLDKTGIPADALRRYPHEFSGGQRQRIVIARALALEPKLLICDESVSALDVSVQAQVLNLLNQLKHELGLTYLFISHDLSVVYHMSDHIMVMKSGKVVEYGDAAKVLDNPSSEYTRMLLDSVPGTGK